ncbi:MAG TPA: hypothetical protein VM529_21105 [Gemmata sp.]|nr:hypothetical protein [Gemmata sp.]
MIVAGLTAAIVSIAAATGITSPVPKDAKPPVACTVAFDQKRDPLERDSLSVTLINNTPDAIEFFSTLPAGILGFLDVNVEGPDGKRVSPEFYDAMISSPFAPPARLVGELDPTKPLKISLWLARYAGKPEELTPGKYRARVKFSYSDRVAMSDWVTFEVPSGRK